LVFAVKFRRMKPDPVAENVIVAVLPAVGTLRDGSRLTDHSGLAVQMTRYPG
jgi:hypothetical protein